MEMVIKQHPFEGTHNTSMYILENAGETHFSPVWTLLRIADTIYCIQYFLKTALGAHVSVTRNNLSSTIHPESVIIVTTKAWTQKERKVTSVYQTLYGHWTVEPVFNIFALLYLAIMWVLLFISYKFVKGFFAITF